MVSVSSTKVALSKYKKKFGLDSSLRGHTRIFNMFSFGTPPYTVLRFTVREINPDDQTCIYLIKDIQI